MKTNKISTNSYGVNLKVFLSRKLSTEIATKKATKKDKKAFEAIDYDLKKSGHING